MHEARLLLGGPWTGPPGGQPTDRPPRILFLGAHCDDIEIGCGGTILRWRAAQPEAEMTWVTLTSTPARREEALAGARRFLGEDARAEVRDFRDGFLPYEPAVKEFFEELAQRVKPDIIFTHYREDRHQDHRVVSDLTWNTWRDHLILEYEVPKYDGDLGQPNFFVPVDAPDVEAKVDAILETYATQRAKGWFTSETLKGLMRLRGVESRADSGYAEAFYARKLVAAVAGDEK